MPQFRLRSQTIFAVGSANILTHTHIYHLSIRRSPLARCMHWLLSWLPRTVQTLSLLPATWCLPPNIVLKRLKPRWEDEFANELRMYERLRSLQGRVVPVCYGEATCDDGTPALVLSDVGGTPLCEDDMMELPEQRLRAMFEESFSAMVSLGVNHDDPKLDNFHLVGDRVVILDLESVYVINPEFFTTSASTMVSELMGRWKYYRQMRRDEWTWERGQAKLGVLAND